MTDVAAWRPTASREALESRARQLAWVRGFFAQRGVLEVETPVLGHHGASDLNIDSVRASVLPVAAAPATTAWLQTSPEYHMKRLLAAGSGPIFQVARVFRDGERGNRHNPEFSLLEWYRPDFDDRDLMDEVARLVCGWLECEWPEIHSYRDVMRRYAGIDPFAATDREIARRCEEWLDPAEFPGMARDGYLDLLMSYCVEPALRRSGPTFITHYPASQAALARVSTDGDGYPVAHRFELYVNGIELCNGYWELTDPDEQARRFAADNAARKRAGKVGMPADQNLLAALAAGMPCCAGVALGLDRLLMLKLGTRDIADVLAFPFERA